MACDERLHAHIGMSMQIPDDRLGGAEHELQHSDSWSELAGGHVLHVADGACRLHCHHVILVPQAAFQEVIEAACLTWLPGARLLDDLSYVPH